MSGLTPDQLRQFGHDGYVVVPGLVPPDRVRAANAAIDGLLAERPPPAGTVGQHSYVEKPPGAQPALLDLLTATPAYAVAEQLTAVGGLTGPSHIQVALTFPPYQHIPGGGHVDGLNTVDGDGRPKSFTMLVGVILSDQTADDMGNVHVWPGSHRGVVAYVREHGLEALLAAAKETAQPPVDMSVRAQVHGQPGDVVFAHYLLAHNIGGNTSDVIRRSVYMRLTRVGHEEHWRGMFSDPLAEYDGVRAVACEPD